MSSSIANKLSRNPYLTDNETQFLLTEMQGFRDGVSVAAENDIYIPFADEVRLRGESHTIRQHLTGVTAHPENRIKELTRLQNVMIRKISSGGKSYPLTHSNNGNPFTYVKAQDSKFGGGIVFDGTNYISIADSARLNPTDQISFGSYHYPKADAGNQTYVKKNLQYWLRQDNTLLKVWVYIAGSWGSFASFDISALLNTWMDVFVTWKSPNLKLYVNGTLQSTITNRTGTLNTTTNKLSLGSDLTIQKVVTGHRMAWTSMLHKEVSAAWITDHSNGILDTNGTNEEILTIPFTGHTKPQPESTFGIAI